MVFRITSARKARSVSEADEVEEPSVLKTRGFEAFQSKYEKRVWGYIANGMRQHRDDIADLTQDTFLRAFENQHQLLAETARGERAWVFSIAERVCLGHYRHEKRRRETRSRLDPLEGTTDAELERVDEREAAERRGILDGLQKLPAMYRIPIELRVLEGHAYVTIGKRMDETPAAIRLRVKRGLQQLRFHVRREDDRL